MDTAVIRVLTLLLVAVPCAFPQLPEAARQKLAEAAAMASEGRFDSSGRLLLELEKQYPEDAELKYRLGLVLLRQGKSAEAQERLEAAVRLMPGSPQAWLAVARTWLQSGKTDEAVEAIEEANRLAPQEPFVWRASAMFYEQAGDFEKAGQYELQWFQAQPQDKISRLRAMEYFILANRAEPAIELGRAALADEDLAVVHNLLGRAYRLQHDPAKAVEELQTALRMDPEQPNYYTDLGQLFLDHNTPEPALMILERASQKFPRNPEVLKLYGLAHYAAGNQQKALENFLKITDIDPDSEAGYASLETLLPYAEERLGSIIDKLRAYHERHPTHPLALYLLALALRTQSGETEEPQRLLEEVVSLEPDFWPAYFEMHKKLERDGKLDEAIRVLEKTVALNPNHQQAHFSLARIYARKGEREKARAARQRHHEIVLADREATEKRQAQYPRLPYTVQTGQAQSP